MEKGFGKISLIAIVLFCLTSCSGKKIEKFFVSESFPEQIVKNFTMDKYDGENHKWWFFAVRGDLYEKRKSVVTKNIKVNFYESDGQIGSVVSADRAIIKTDTGDIKADGNIVIFSLLKNTTIFTEALNYNEKSGRISTDAFIRQEKADITVTGIGLKANVDLSDITILKNVKVVKR